MTGNKNHIESNAIKPKPCTIHFANIPQELKDRPQWVLWAYRRRNGKWTKIPYRPGEKEAKAGDPSTWCPFEQVAAFGNAAEAMHMHQYDGIGYEFADDDPYTGIDLDDAIDLQSKQLKPWAQVIVDRLYSYTEVSPSGTGVKIWVKAKKPSNDRSRIKHEDGEVEMYDNGRYFAVTGHLWPGVPATIQERQTEVNELYHRLFDSPNDKNASENRSRAVEAETLSLTDEELIEKAKAAKNGDKFARLWAGDTGDYEGDDSRADAAFCTMLVFWTDKDRQRMDRMFRSSGLMRLKWDERRGEKTYGERTIDEVIQLVQETYRGKRHLSRRGASPVNGSGQPVKPTHPNTPKADGGDMVLDEADDDPHRLAQGFLQRFQKEEMLTLRYWREEFLRWDGRAYRTVAEQEIRAEATQYVRHEFERLHRARRLEWMRNGRSIAGDNKPPPPVQKVSVKLMADVFQALRGIACLPFDREQPMWLNGSEPFSASETLVCSNGLLHLPSWAEGGSGLHPLTPNLFTTVALDYPFDVAAAKPINWLRFLSLLWPDDAQSIAALQEWFGYCLLPDTSQQKMLMLIGPKRSGKGTIARVLSHLIGLHNVASPTLGSLGTPFGLQPLLHKTLAIVSDARLSHRTDTAVVVERLLSVSGEDAQTVDRKYRESLTLKLPVRFLILTNELPKLHDPSGALVGRLILLRMTKSFYGREDTTLTATLLHDLPGILLWAIEGWKRLRQRGRFQLPDSSTSILQQMDDLASPVAAFVRERCEIGLALNTPCTQLFEAWKDWSEAKGMKSGSEQSFGRDLRAAIAGLDTRQQRCGGTRLRVYTGLRLLVEDTGDEKHETSWG